MGEGVALTDSDLEQKLQDGIDAARRGDRPAGRRLLEEVIESDPDNELAWIWLASCVNTLTERRDCLERVLQINPDNTRAREALSALRQKMGETAGADPQQIEQLRRARQTAPRTQPAAPPPAQSGFNPRNLALGLLAVAAVIAGLFIFSALQDLIGGAEPTAVVAPPTPIPPTSTPTVIPTREPNPFQGVSAGATLPPTFTATPSPAPTLPPQPTETPVALEEFVAYYTRLEDGAAQPDLYRIRGDGSGEEFLGAGFDDLAFDPVGGRIAFVRRLEYTDAEGETVLLPELFVADVDNLDGAQQITELETDIVGSPTWSPEGNALVFVTDFGGAENLWGISADGQNLRNLTDNGETTDRDPVWSPELSSTQIVFASDRVSIGQTELFSFEIPEPGVEPEYTRLTVANNSSYAPAWSPDGGRIVFVSDRTVDADIYLMSATGGNEQLLTVDDGGAEDRRPSFTPDGRYVVFISNRDGERFHPYLLSLDRTVLVRLAEGDFDVTSIAYRPEPLLQLR
jgi:PAS domain-containing protein